MEDTTILFCKCVQPYCAMELALFKNVKGIIFFGSGSLKNQYLGAVQERLEDSYSMPLELHVQKFVQ